ncbi:MAG: hypothetical protein Ta2G_21880 [Termitinemataceae bacterium]|nr:MAG: hypothetical protein Ta2G_21880 [Termitinemataceae bacterium]
MKKLQFFGFAVVIAAALVFSACANGDYKSDDTTVGSAGVLTLEKGKKWSYVGTGSSYIYTASGNYNKVDKTYYFIIETSANTGSSTPLYQKDQLFATGVKKGKTLVLTSIRTGSYTKASVDGVETIEIVGELED